MSTVNELVFGNASNIANDLVKVLRAEMKSSDLVNIARAIASTIVGIGLNITFFIIGGKKMVLFPQESLFQLNGFLTSFIIAGIVFFAGSYLTKPGTVEKKSLKLFFHPVMK